MLMALVSSDIVAPPIRRMIKTNMFVRYEKLCSAAVLVTIHVTIAHNHKSNLNLKFIIISESHGYNYALS